MPSTTSKQLESGAIEDEIVPWSEKVWRKSKEEPLVPIGVIATTGTLTMAILSFRKRQSWNMQYWMRARVAAQAFTIGAMCIYYYGSKPTEVEKTRHLDEVSAEREKREKMDREGFLTRLKGAEDQWKESNGGDQKPAVEKDDVNSSSYQASGPNKVKQSTTPGSGWWGMSWLWGRSASHK